MNTSVGEMAAHKMSDVEVDELRRLAHIKWPEAELKTAVAACFAEGIDRTVVYAELDGSFNGNARYTFSFEKAYRAGTEIKRAKIPMRADTVWEGGRCVSIEFSVVKRPSSALSAEMA